MISDTSKDIHPEWLFGGNPKAIEMQEEDGQRELCESKALPRKLNGYDISSGAIDIYKQLGFTVSESEDPLFVKVTFPEGWKVVATDHTMYSNLLDDKGRIRARIFYKAAFYDRDAYISFKRRYSYDVITYLDDKDRKSGEDYYTEKNRTPMYGNVLDSDSGNVIFETARSCFTEKYNESNHIEWWKAFDAFQKAKHEECMKFLDEQYPDWRSIYAYW